jgi:hypothetical protein
VPETLKGETMKRILLLVFIFCVSLVIPSHGQATLRYAQGPFTVTTGTVMRPFACANNGTCPGTPTWSTDANVNICMVTVIGTINWDITGANPATGANPTTGAQWTSGVWFISSKPGAPNVNLQRFRMIATTANTNVTISCGW